MKKDDVELTIHTVQSENATYMEINDVINLVEHVILGITTGMLDVQNVITQLKEKADEN